MHAPPQVQEEDKSATWHSGVWVAKHRHMRTSEFKVTDEYCPWKALGKDIPLRSPRCRDMIELGWAARPVARRGLPWFCNVSQCCTRRPWGATLKTLCTNTRIWSYSQNRMLEGADYYTLQGFPIGEWSFEDVSVHQLNLMSAEGMFLPNLAVLMLAIFLSPSAPWHNP